MKKKSAPGRILKRVHVTLDIEWQIHDFDQALIDKAAREAKKRKSVSGSLSMVRNVLFTLLANKKAFEQEALAELMCDIDSGDLLKAIEAKTKKKYSVINPFDKTMELLLLSRPSLKNGWIKEAHEYEKETGKIGQKIWDLFTFNIMQISFR